MAAALMLMDEYLEQEIVQLVALSKNSQTSVAKLRARLAGKTRHPADVEEAVQRLLKSGKLRSYGGGTVGTPKHAPKWGG